MVTNECIPDIKSVMASSVCVSFVLPWLLLPSIDVVTDTGDIALDDLVCLAGETPALDVLVILLELDWTVGLWNRSVECVDVLTCLLVSSEPRMFVLVVVVVVVVVVSKSWLKL